LRDAHRLAARRIRTLLIDEACDWIAGTGLPADFSGLYLCQMDRAFLTTTRGAIARALPGPAEDTLRKALQLFFRIALAQGWVAADPMVKPPAVMSGSSRTAQMVAKRSRQPGMPDRSELARLLSDCDDWVALADWLTIEASARPQEVRAIMWTDITLHPRRNGAETGGTLTILRSMGSGEDGVEPGHTKTDESQRVVEFGAALAGHLRALMPPKGLRHRYVASPDGHPVSSWQLLTARKARQVRLGIARPNKDGVSRRYENFFDGRQLRHAFAARRIDGGMDHNTLARQMGHKYHQITLNLYGYLFKRQCVRVST
jgi:integrase